jgi:hypothetical protein
VPVPGLKTDMMLTMCNAPTHVPKVNNSGVTSAFLEVLPRVAAVARFAFRRLQCPETRADRVSQMRREFELSWKAFHAGAGGAR